IAVKPTHLPTGLDYAPADGETYKVKASDSWWTLAELPQVKAAGLSPLDHCYYNFKTRRPNEINWYLREKVGCRVDDQRRPELSLLAGRSSGRHLSAEKRPASAGA